MLIVVTMFWSISHIFLLLPYLLRKTRRLLVSSQIPVISAMIGSSSRTPKMPPRTITSLGKSLMILYSL